MLWSCLSLKIYILKVHVPIDIAPILIEISTCQFGVKCYGTSKEPNRKKSVSSSLQRVKTSPKNEPIGKNQSQAMSGNYNICIGSQAFSTVDSQIKKTL